MMFKVLVIDDEHELLSLTVEYLTQNGFVVKGLTSAVEALTVLDSFSPHVVLLDQNMPQIKGQDFVRQLRENVRYADLAVIMITGSNEEDQMIRAFDIGVDDYLLKPFSLRELTARVQSICRRKRHVPISSGLSFDLTGHRVILNGQDVALTLTEFNLLKTLYHRPNEVWSRENLCVAALGSQHVTDRTIDVHIASIRRKLGDFGKDIKTVRGVGYKFIPIKVQQVAKLSS